MLQELQLESEIRALEMEVDIQKWPTFNIPKMDQVMNSRFFFFLTVRFEKS